MVLKIRNHLFFWIGYVTFKTILNLTAIQEPVPTPALEWLVKIRINFLAQVSLLIIKVPLVYSVFSIIDKYFENELKLTSAALFSTMVFFVSIPLFGLLNQELTLPYIYHYTGQSSSWNWGSITYIAFNLGSVLAIATSIKLMRKQLLSQVNEQNLMRERAEAELKFLKAQISPHFLFNTLNNIYSLARKNSPNTSDVVLKLSKLMRFILYDAAHREILLVEEVKLIEDYIELEKLRYSNRLIVTYHQEIDNRMQRIAPLILVHFVENAFKHGAAESRFDSRIDIHISLLSNVLRAVIKNSKEEQVYEKSENKIGLDNAQRQLELLYPGHELLIKDEKENYTVQLVIHLNPVP